MRDRNGLQDSMFRDLHQNNNMSMHSQHNNNYNHIDGANVGNSYNRISSSRDRSNMRDDRSNNYREQTYENKSPIRSISRRHKRKVGEIYSSKKERFVNLRNDDVR